MRQPRLCRLLLVMLITGLIVAMQACTNRDHARDTLNPYGSPYHGMHHPGR